MNTSDCAVAANVPTSKRCRGSARKNVGAEKNCGSKEKYAECKDFSHKVHVHVSNAMEISQRRVTHFKEMNF